LSICQLLCGLSLIIDTPLLKAKYLLNVLKFLITICRFLGRTMINFWRLGEMVRQDFLGLMPSWFRFGFWHPFSNKAIINGRITLKFHASNQGLLIQKCIWKHFFFIVATPMGLDASFGTTFCCVFSNSRWSGIWHWYSQAQACHLFLYFVILYQCCFSATWLIWFVYC
jgi:hypothetical protein